MSKIDYEKLEKSLKRLKEQYEFFKENEESLSGNIKDGVQESVIKRFEICYDTLRKHLKKFMEEESGLPDVPSSPKQIFRMTHESGLIDQGMHERLVSYNTARVNSTHDYSMEKAEETLNEVANFIQDATELYEQMIG